MFLVYVRNSDVFSLIMIIIVVFIENHNKQKKDAQCQIYKKGLEIFFLLLMQNKKKVVEDHFLKG